MSRKFRKSSRVYVGTSLSPEGQLFEDRLAREHVEDYGRVFELVFCSKRKSRRPYLAGHL